MAASYLRLIRKSWNTKGLMRNAEKSLTYYSQVNALTHLHWGSIIQLSTTHHLHVSSASTIHVIFLLNMFHFHICIGSKIQFSKMHHPHSSKTLNNAANKIFIGPLRQIFMLQINNLLCGNLETHCWLHIWKEYNTFSKVSSGYWWIHNPETRRRNNCVHLRLEEWKNDGKKRR